MEAGGSPLIASLTYRAVRPLFGTPFYRMMLGGHGPAGMATVPPDLWPGDAERGAEITRDSFSFAARGQAGDAKNWEMRDAAQEWVANLHGFDWLRHNRALGGEAGRDKARRRALAWIDLYPSWEPIAWRSDILASRIVAWLTHYPVFFADPDHGVSEKLMASVAQQLKHLRRVAGCELDGAARLRALKGLVIGSACLQSEQRRLPQAIALLTHEIERQILPDGGHGARCPTMQLQVLRDLIEVRATLDAAELPVPSAIGNAIDRMAPIVRFFRHGDGRFALMNGGNEDNAAAIDMVLGHTESRERPPASAPDIGFERLSAGRLLAICDVGPPPPGMDHDAHAGTLSLEVSDGRDRLIVNCGAAPQTGVEWRMAQRATAAHSTAMLEETNSSALGPRGGIADRRASVTATRAESDGQIWIDAEHDGYQEPFGIRHRRRVYLAGTGDDLRAEDVLTGRGGHQFAVRLHLHPDVQVSLLHNRAAALLRLPGGAAWKLRASGAEIALADSVYLGQSDQIRRTQQVVLSGLTQAGTTTVKWALQRDGTTA